MYIDPLTYTSYTFVHTHRDMNVFVNSIDVHLVFFGCYIPGSPQKGGPGADLSWLRYFFLSATSSDVAQLR